MFPDHDCEETIPLWFAIVFMIIVAAILLAACYGVVHLVDYFF